MEAECAPGKSVKALKLQILESLPTEDSENLDVFLRKPPLCCRIRMRKRQLPGRVTEFICLPYTMKTITLAGRVGGGQHRALLEQW